MTAPASDYFREGPLHAARVASLKAACESWIGTPFRQRSCIKGPLGGVDCASFVGAVFLEIGAISQPISIPPYSLNHADHSDQSLLRSWFDQPEVRRRVRILLDENEPDMVGDMVFPRVGLIEHHLGLQVGGEIYHVVRPAGVCCQTLAGLALHKFTLHRSRYRLLEP